MAKNNSLNGLFATLLEAYESGEDESIRRARRKLEEQQLRISVVTRDNTEWLNSEFDGFAKVPLVRQEINIRLGHEIVHTEVRDYGVEFIDPTHTGFGGEWEVIRVDDSGAGF